MKRKCSGTTDLRAFLARAAKKKQSEQESVVAPTSNEAHMQLVLFQGQSSSGPSTAQVPPPIEDDEDSDGFHSVHLSETDSSDKDDGESGDGNNIYGIEHDPGLRIPISSYDVNDQDSVRMAYIALGPCRPKMKKDDFPRHDCGAQAEYMIEALRLGEIETGQGLNQEMGLARPGDTRWGSHYRTVMHVMALYHSIKKVLSKIGKENKGAGVERIFSSMNYIKNKLRSKMGQKFLNGCLVTFIEREFFLQVKDEDIIAQFQSMKDRKVIL